MNLRNVGVSLALPLLLVACASKDSYRDQHGRASATVPAYDYRQGYAPSAGTSAAPAAGAAQEGSADVFPELRWPRLFFGGNATNTVYQPQVDSWDGTTLVARSAVSVQPAGQKQSVYGVVNINATTLVNKSERTVKLENVRIVGGDFPSAPGKTEEFLAGIRQEFPKIVGELSLDSLEASLAANEQQLKAGAQPLNNTPPKIVFSTVPAILVPVDGPPVFRPVNGTELERVVNTRVLLVKDKQARPVYYLHVLDGYMQAPSLDGPWAPGAPPPGSVVLEKEVAGATDLQTDLLEGQPDPATGVKPSLARGAPEIFVSTAPAELITFGGQPDFVPIPGTKLLYVKNTTGNVFKLMTDQQNYVLISGRWFRGPNLGGPWEYVAGNALPGDFARIPDNSPKENVKASVPGTPQAREALIANSIPQNSAVARTNQMDNPGFDGAPQLAPIAGTPLQYVVNSGTPIIRVDAQSWYACQNGVWYGATSVNGPWVVAASVPAVIYSIPPSSPMHYVTYVRVYNSNSDYVYEGYTPGYLGTVVSPDYVVVYGTGYYYRPWVGSYWYGGPVTWGYGWDPFWAPWSGWSFGFGFGWYSAYYYPYWPCWGPYRYWDHHHHWGYPAWGPGGYANTSVNVYHRPSPRSGSFTARPPTSGGRTPTGGTVYGRAYNSRTGALVSGDQAQVRNVFRGSGRTTPGATAPAGVGRDTAFATKDGQVYIRQGRSGSWRPAATTGSQVRQAPVPGLSRENDARVSGQQRNDAFRRSEPSARAETPRFSGEGRRGGDGGGRVAPSPSRGGDGGGRAAPSPSRGGDGGGRSAPSSGRGGRER